MSVILPTIHMNGTSRASLLGDLIAAIDALRLAGEAVGRTVPNGRDYYPQGAEAFRQAQEAHAKRARDIDAVRRELNEIAEGIAT
jgi:hypothetical protein